ncbi:nitrogen regulatory protein P-II family [Fodinibius salinus]|uniref:Nitrogen regulatory protein P-II family n=1 Tax=Fodinibius salinus TaxID=860790 RepID=A0A5D3YLJ8_9BACT|nr:P-II family nitrogen regulator [Fodinibius salinus]TYP93571.1 nitrogen regulatory protein P-II family [Fodinibius salinus]
MKLVKAYIRPKLLEDVYRALRNEGYCCMTVFEGEGTGRYSDPDHQHGSLNFPAMHTHVVKIEIAVESEDVNPVIDIITEHGKTGHKGDGIVFVCPIEKVTRIRDGEEGASVLK